MQLLYGRKQKTILIIEDDQKVALGLAIRMKSAGYEAIMAHDALSGVRSAIRNRPDLVLLDISMPGKSGLDIVSDVKEEFPDLAILILSMYNDEWVIRLALEKGVSSYLSKGVSPKILIDTIRKLHPADQTVPTEEHG